jgi:hypothetical protein
MSFQISNIIVVHIKCWRQRVTKSRFRLSWLTNSVLVYDPKCRGGGGVAGSQPISLVVHMEPK